MIGFLHQLTYNFLFFCAPRFISTWESFTLFTDIRWKDCFLNTLLLDFLFYMANIFFCTIIKRFFCKEPRMFLVNVKIDCSLR